MNNIKIDFKYIIIAVLVSIILVMKACDNHIETIDEPIVLTKYDTVWKHTHDTIIKKVNVVKIIHPKEPVFLPGDNIDTCKSRFNELAKEYTAKLVYCDTIKLDSIGIITVVDTVSYNKIKDRKYIRNYKIPLVTKTTTIIKPTDPKRQLYFGGNLFGNNRNLQSISPGIIYKDKKDRIFQANVGLNFDGQIIYGIGTYWKIKFKK
jgi:hypothetical protein